VDLGVGYPDDVDQTASTLGRLWQAEHEELRVIVSAPTVASAWADASLSWLVRPGSDAFNDRPAGVRVGVSDVDRVQVTVDAFARLDNTFGGGHARRALIEFLRSDVTAMLAGRYTEPTGRALHAAVSEATLLGAWMSYDAGAHGLAQRYFIQALRLAQAADDVLLAGSILDAMSHQATFLGRYREAANLARAARHGTAARATATLTAHFHAMEARALAAGGDGIGSQRALSEAVRVFERRRPGDDPDWIAYVNDAELSAEFGHCFRDLGRSTDAVTYALRAITGASVRSDFFVTMVLAAAYLGGGELDEACAAAKRALDLGAGLKSARCAEYVRAFRAQLDGFARLPAVVELSEHASEHPLWQPAGAAA
jgi:tetratricopeptide (TPR) repeat protein